MSCDIRSFFTAATPSPVQAVRGRPRSGAGSRGSAVHARDAHSRLLSKRKRSAAAAERSSSSSSDDEPVENNRARARSAKRVNWSLPEPLARLQRACTLVQQGLSLRAAASHADVPFAVLQRRISGEVEMSAALGASTALTAEQEQHLAQYALCMAERGFGKDVGELQALARKLSNSPTFKASPRWWKLFLRRHPELARRRAQGYERLRATAMNAGVVKQYFLLLHSAFAKVQQLSGGMQLTADRIYNMDEIGFQFNAVQPYIVTRKGTKHTASIAANCRVTTSVAVCVSASGFVQPPFFIVKGLRRPNDYLASAPAGSAFEMAKKGVMTTEVFARWVAHFVQHLEQRASTHWNLLVLDGHHSHTMDPGVLQLLRQNRVYVIALPSHTTAQLQLLDVAVFGPLKRAFRKWIQEWKELNPLEKLDKKFLPTALHSIWSQLHGEMIRKGAASTGLYPLNINWAAQNTHKMHMAKTFSQLSLPGTVSFAAHTSSLRSLAALDLAMSPAQLSDLHQRIAAAASMPRLNALGENMAQARLLNSEERVKKLFQLQDAKKEALLQRAAKRKQRAAKKEAALAKKLQSQHAKHIQRAAEEPLVRVLADHGYISSAQSKPTVGELRTFAQRQGLKPGACKRQQLIALLLEEVRTKSENESWLHADEECKHEHVSASKRTRTHTAGAQRTDESSSDAEHASQSSDDSSDSENWNDFAIRF